ncbi:MAG: YqgE/AlgH family protein [Gammaproteobacteria bacterium]|nr:YqgE/AlgH family protein [Gammaproteobacteria bacterium]
MEQQTQSSTFGLNDQFLIAMPQLSDSFFENSVIYMWQHSDEGAIGIAVNLPLPITLSELFEQLGIDDERPSDSPQTVLCGGPVEPNKGFILHDSAPNSKVWEATLNLKNSLFITTSRDILEDIAKGKGPRNYFVVLGCAGWGPGQLEQEITENSWFSCPAEKELIFSTEFQNKAKLAAASLGFELSQLSSDQGSC